MTEHEREHESEHEREHKELAEKPRSLVGREAPPFEAEALLPPVRAEMPSALLLLWKRTVTVTRTQVMIRRILPIISNTVMINLQK